jgi:hypothetical protein
MGGTTGSGNRASLPRRRKPLKTPDSGGYAGTRRRVHWKALERFSVQREPHGSCESRQTGSLASGSVEDPGAPVRRGMVRPAAEDSSVRGDSGGESRRDGPEVMCSEGGLERPGTMAMEPGRAGSSVFEPAELATSYSSEFEADEHRGRKDARGAETRLWPDRSKGLSSRNPVSGSGPSVSARLRREQTVEGVKNPEGGRCRV